MSGKKLLSANDVAGVAPVLLLGTIVLVQELPDERWVTP